MFTPVDTKDPRAVEAAVRTAYREILPQSDAAIVARMFACATHCFRGECVGYQPIDARYHDLEHTLQATLCLVRLLTNRHRAGVEPVLTQRLFELGAIAVLLHDSGYAKQAGDPDGTGAKHTFTHVLRSTEFAAELMRGKGFADRDIQATQHMIRCTGFEADLAAIPFEDELERTVGYALGTADLLGQMAADDYVDKLPILYGEFEEAMAFVQGRRPPQLSFHSAAELIQQTPAFWESQVWVKLNRDFGGLYRFLSDPYPDGPNEYLERIRANLARIRPPATGVVA